MDTLPTVELFKLDDNAPPFVPASHDRTWMDETHDRYAYRCTPLTIANASGWELRCPFTFEATWDGSMGLDAIQIRTAAKPHEISGLIASHFGHGILTFHTGWLVRTSAGWATWARGTPNLPKDGITPLDGVVETEWLPFPFTMNWRFSRPGSVTFERGEPFCFITIVPHAILDDVQPVVRQLSEEPELSAKFESWRDSRAEFNAKLQSLDETATGLRWQRGYTKGVEADRLGAYHLSRRRLRPPLP